MGSQNRIVPVVVLLVAALVLQLVLLSLDSRQPPAKVAAQFTKDYFYLDADMGQYLCAGLANDGQTVGQFLYQKDVEASRRGFSTHYLRRLFTELHLKTVYLDATHAHVHVEGTTRKAINPVYMLIGKLFFIGKNDPVNATLDLVKEKSGWRVCGSPFDLKRPD